MVPTRFVTNWGKLSGIRKKLSNIRILKSIISRQFESSNKNNDKGVDQLRSVLTCSISFE